MLGGKIKELRKNKGLTQTELGVLVGVHQGAIAMYETNALVPPTRRIIRIANALDVPAADLFACVTTESADLPVPA